MQKQRQITRLLTRLSIFSFELNHVPGLKNTIADGLSRFSIKVLKMKPLTITPIHSHDTNDPNITIEDEKEFETYKQAAIQLRDTQHAIKQTNFVHMLQTEKANSKRTPKQDFLHLHESCENKISMISWMTMQKKHHFIHDQKHNTMSITLNHKQY